MDIETTFYTQAARSLAGCQLVEQALKLYVTEALLFIAKCVDSRIPFRMVGDDYDNTSLGGLIEVFNKLSANSQLVSSLKAFTRERNFLSHRAIASCLDPDGEVDYSGLDDLSERLIKIEREARRLVGAVHEEGNRVRVFLDFVDLDAPSGAGPVIL